MADTQYDLPPKVVKLFHEKQKIREAIRQEVLKRETNPHLGHGTALDSAITKYHALFHYRNEHVRTNVKNVGALLLTFVLPVGLLFFDIMRIKEKKESLYRSGKIPYEDRCYKSIV